MTRLAVDPHRAWISPWTDPAEDQKPDPGSARPLAGIGLGVKDNIDVADLVTTHGSSVFADSAPAGQDAPAVARLRAAGTTIRGKTHMTELACGTTGYNSHFGQATNPHDPNRHPGGSSSGSAIAVAQGDVDLALGSDTGGSIRIPAAACGVIGFKPTFGRVPTAGMGVCSRSLDHLGPIAASVELVAEALRVMQEPGWPSIVVDAAAGARLSAAVLIGPFLDRCDATVADAFEFGVDAVRSLGAEVIELDLGAVGVDLGSVSEVANPLSRDLLDHFGWRDGPPDGLDPEVGEWLDFYATVDDVEYRAALAEQKRLRAAMAVVQSDVDVLLCPTLRTQPCAIADAAAQPRELRAGNLELFNVTGQPSLTLPFGTSDGLAAGLLITGRVGEDHHVLNLAAALERSPGAGV